MERLQIEAQRLKRRFGLRHHALIDQNLKRVAEQMEAAPGSIAIQEGVIALSAGLPSRPRSLTLTRARNARGKARGKEAPRK